MIRHRIGMSFEWSLVNVLWCASNAFGGMPHVIPFTIPCEWRTNVLDICGTQTQTQHLHIGQKNFLSFFHRKKEKHTIEPEPECERANAVAAQCVRFNPAHA